MIVTDADARFMRAALALGRRGLGRTAPNPAVAALVVKDGLVLGRGVTADGGRPHAEALALAQAAEAARGATLYVTLEPCSHHGVTPPCCQAIVAAGVARVVYALLDPNPLVAGQGASYCRAHNLEVVGDIEAEAAAHDHLGHINRLTRQRPMITLKLAETADGYVAGGPYDKRLAITGAASNGFVHVMRAMHDAILVGVETVLADDPLMTVRLPGLIARPQRIVLDSAARTPPRARLIETASEAPVLLLVGPDAPPDRVAILRSIDHVEVATVPAGSEGRIDLAAALALLAARGVTRVFSEGGPRVASALLHADVVDEVLVFTASRPLGAEGVAIWDARSRAHLAARFALVETRELGADRLRRHQRIT